MGTRFGVALLVGGVLLAGCGGAEDPEAGATDGFQPVRVGASGFSEGAPQPTVAGSLSVSKIVDGATFFARVEDAGGTDLAEGENARFRLAGVDVPVEDDDCLARTSATHLEGTIRGGQQVRFVVAEGGDVEDPDGVPVHLWARGIWVNGEVLARGYGRDAGAGEGRRENLEAAQAFAEDGEQGLWNPSLCPADGGTPSPGAEEG
ncbi:MAG: hypothetical protein KY461_09365 [Actinobacteria bacterium]|nr:hypothetical protein [Actinomycetota bacterium]